MEENPAKWMAIAVVGLAIVFVGLYAALKPSYHERLETSSTRLLNDTIISVGVAHSESYINYSSPITYAYDSLADWEYFEKEMEKDKKAMALKDQLFANIDLKTRRVVGRTNRGLHG